MSSPSLSGETKSGFGLAENIILPHNNKWERVIVELIFNLTFLRALSLGLTRRLMHNGRHWTTYIKIILDARKIAYISLKQWVLA